MSPLAESPTTAENLLHSTIYTLFGVRYSVFDIRYFLTPNTEHRISNTKPNVGVNIPYTPSGDANNGRKSVQEGNGTPALMRRFISQVEFICFATC